MDFEMHQVLYGIAVISIILAVLTTFNIDQFLLSTVNVQAGNVEITFKGIRRRTVALLAIGTVSAVLGKLQQP